MKYLFLILSGFSVWAVTPKEPRIKIVVIDTGLKVTKEILPYLCKYGHFSTQGNVFKDTIGHGTNVTGLIAERIDPKKYCILMIKYTNSFNSNAKDYVASLRYIKSLDNVGFVNLSLGGTDIDTDELWVLDDLLRRGVKISVSAGNFNQDLDKNCNVFPACYSTIFGSNFHVVGSSTQYAGRAYSNYGAVVKYHEDGTRVGTPPMTGTSQAAAIHTGKWVSGRY